MILSLLAALTVFAQTNPGSISAANATGFAAPPSSTAPWTAQSYVPIQSNGGTTYLSVTSSSGNGTLHIYATLGNGPLVQVNDNSITRIDTGVAGPIAAGTSTIYAVPLPPGVSYLAASAWVSGSVSAFGTSSASNSSALVTQPGFGWSQDVSYVGSSPVNANVSKASAATLCGFWAGNYTGSIRYLMLFNSASTPTNGATPVLRYPIGIGVSTSPTFFSLGASFFGTGGLAGKFTTGLSWAISTTDGTLTLASATDCDVEVDYK
jgi:hypothetical protein